MDAVYSFAFVDFRDLIWRTVLHLTHVILSMKLDSGVNEVRDQDTDSLITLFSIEKLLFYAFSPPCQVILFQG